MSYWMKKLIYCGVIFSLLIAAVVFVSNPALADFNNPRTQAMEEIINAISPGDERPSEAGHLSANFLNPAGDTLWISAEAEVDAVVDTGWDMWDITTEINPTISGNSHEDTQLIEPGGQLVIAIPVQNQSNNAKAIEFDASHLLPGDIIEGDTFSVELWYQAGELGAGDFDTETATALDDSEGSVEFVYQQIQTFFAVVEAKSTAVDGNSTTSEFWVTNNAPVRDPSNPEWGDNWSMAAGPGSEDGNDTQSLTINSQISGPRLTLVKAQSVVDSDTRPGGKIDYTITVENIGSAVATELEIIDALPAHTTLSEWATADGTPTIEYSTDYLSPNWEAEGEHAIEDVLMIRWFYTQIDEAESFDLEFQVEID